MTDKFENIENAEITLNENGDIELSDALQDAVVGGFSPEEEEAEGQDGRDGESNICGNNCDC